MMIKNMNLRQEIMQILIEGEKKAKKEFSRKRDLLAMLKYFEQGLDKKTVTNKILKAIDDIDLLT